MNLLYKTTPQSGIQTVIGDSSEVLEYCHFDVLRLSGGDSFKGSTGGYETVLVIIHGTATFTVGEEKWENVGNRESVFSQKATSLYVPIETEYEVTEASGNDLEIAVCKVRAEEKHKPFLVTPDDVVIHHRGQATWERDVHDIIADSGKGRVQRIVIGETFSAPGGWSSYPPHKHDQDTDEEVKMEEIYYFQIEPQQGFGVQLVYTEDGEINESYIIRQGDAVALHKGYHPVCAAGGYQVYYLWFLGGASSRDLKPFDQPAHRWLMQK